MKYFKAFTSAFKLLIYSSFVSFTMKSIGCLLEMVETGVVCVCVEAELADIGVRGWPGRGVISSLAGVIVLSAERTLKCSSTKPSVRSSYRVSSTNSLSQLLAVMLLVCANKRSTEGYFLLIFLI